MLRTLAATVILLALCAAAYATEPYVTGTYQPTPEGYLVAFTVYNPLGNPTPNQSLMRWFIVTPDASNPTAPTGWQVVQNSREVNWSALDTQHQVGPGRSLAGFSFVAPSAPGPLTWAITTNVTGYTGTVTPTAVPEPSSILALGAGGFGILGAALRRRGRRGV